MAEPWADDLSYGRLGEPLYDGSVGQWLYPREPKEGFNFKPVGPFVTSIPPSTTLAGNRRKNVSAQVLTQEAKGIAARQAELTPGLASIASFALTSHITASLTATHDPLVSDRLSFGKAEYEVTTSNIVAITAGKAGTAVRLIPVKPAKFSCAYHEIGSVAVPEFGTAVEGWWSAYGSKVQQLACADGNSTYMAVRLLHSTVILRPCYLRATESGSNPTFSSLGSRSPLRLDANPVVELFIERTGGTPHADVNFNPWRQCQVAIVDQEGAWSVWELFAQEHEFEPYGVKSVAMGHIFDGHESEVPSQFVGDGWGAVRFAGSSDILVVCNRVHMAIFHVSTGLTQLGLPNIGLSRSSDWILDLERSPHNRSHIFLVTSSQVFCIRVTLTGEGDGKGKTQAVATTLRSWCHFRERDDTSLRLEVSDHDRGHILLLYSRLNNLVTIFQLSSSSLSPSQAVVVFDPHAMSLSSAHVEPYYFPSSGSGTQNQSSISDIALLHAPHKRRVLDDVLMTDPGHNDSTDTSFYKLFMLQSDLSVRECVYVGRTGKATDDARVDALYRLTRTRKQESAASAADDRVVVSDDGEAVATDQADKMILEDETVGSKPKQTLFPKPDDIAPDVWTVNSESLYELVTGATRSRSLTMSSLALDERDRKLSPGLLRDLIDMKRKDGALGIKSFFEILEHVPDHTDIDDAASRVDEVRESVTNYRDVQGDGQTVLSEELGSARLLDLNIHSEGHLVPLNASLICTYDHLVENWLRPLRSTIPERTRMARERTIRRVAMILCLARAGVNLQASGNPSSVIKTDRTSSISRQFDLPMRGQGSLGNTPMDGNGRTEEASSSPPRSSQLSVDAGFLGGSQLEDNESKTRFSRSAPALTVTSHSSRPNTTSNDNTEDPACTRLRQYTTVDFQPRLPPSMSRLLSHWAQGSDPVHYDWSIATASTSAPSDVAGADDEGQKKSALRRKRFSKAKLASRPNPHRLWGSQPQLLQPAPSSSQLVEDIAPMSQVERGLHGGRPGPSTKQGAQPRKPRVAGF